jgi:hypothetical protein
MPGRIPRRRSLFRIARASSAASPSTTPGRVRARPLPPPFHPKAFPHLLKLTTVLLVPRPHCYTPWKPFPIHQNVHFCPFPPLMPIDPYLFSPFFASTRVESMATPSIPTFPIVYPQSRRA